MSQALNIPKKYMELGQLINLLSMLNHFTSTPEIKKARAHLEKLIAERITQLT